jgi:hypothetical protein
MKSLHKKLQKCKKMHDHHLKEAKKHGHEGMKVAKKIHDMKGKKKK